MDPKLIEAKAIELYGGPNAQHGDPPVTYDQLPQRLKTQWRKFAREKLRDEPPSRNADSTSRQPGPC